MRVRFQARRTVSQSAKAGFKPAATAVGSHSILDKFTVSKESTNGLRATQADDARSTSQFDPL